MTGLNAAEQANFDRSNVTLLSQYTSMTDGTLGTADQRSASRRGQPRELPARPARARRLRQQRAGKLYRQPRHVLGDTVNGQPIYVRAPFAFYSDPGYAAFKPARAAPADALRAGQRRHAARLLRRHQRRPTWAGEEAWSFVPTSVLPNMWKLADNNYKNMPPVLGRRHPVGGRRLRPARLGRWKTILVGGLNAGGKGYYALDMTDPRTPKGMWEFKQDPAVCPDHRRQRSTTRRTVTSA